MQNFADEQLSAFDRGQRIAHGSVRAVALAVKAAVDAGAPMAIQVFADTDARPVDLDLRGSADEVSERYAQVQMVRGPGRPKLGVQAREITLLPRHWEWLNSQPGGASVALRKLVESARRDQAEADRQRLAVETTYRFILATAGNESGFEEATRALFAGDTERFGLLIANWPSDLVEFALQGLRPAPAPAG